jgi:hypothetical protein
LRWKCGVLKRVQSYLCGMDFSWRFSFFLYQSYIPFPMSSFPIVPSFPRFQTRDR